MPMIQSAELAVTTFVASSYASEACGSNGLPLTPNSICILGRFQILKSFTNQRICQYIDIVRGKHERLYVVSEHYQKSVQDLLDQGLEQSIERFLKIIFETIQGLIYLNQSGLVHRCLSPHTIKLTHKDEIKLSRYGLYYMTNFGTNVTFPIGEPKYMSPESLCSLLHTNNPFAESPENSSLKPSGPKADVWSLGIILIELYLGRTIWKEWTISQIISRILSFLSQGSVVHAIFMDENSSQKLQSMPTALQSFLELCLNINPQKRSSPSQLIQNPLFEKYNFQVPNSSNPDIHSFPSVKLRSENLKIPEPIDYDVREIDHLRERPLAEIYYLWKLVGGDVEAEYRRQGSTKALPPICTLPSLVVDECQCFGEKQDRSFLLDHKTVILSLEQLKQRLDAVSPDDYYPLLENGSTSMTKTQSSTELMTVSQLPLVIREKDVEYQLHRLILLSRLLECYPYKRNHIFKEARNDIPPLYRAHIWAALLDVEGDVRAIYDSIDKETPTSTDRQIEVDIPRCHQYDELLSSPTGHAKFKRILKAWVVNHQQYVYWQGLDSLCAPFLYLNFNDEALAYACLTAFIPKYLNKFFLKDNSAIIQEYLAVFAHLIAFHDPELATHLDSIGFIPELYAIPWFLTMYTHVFPLSKIFHLWDTLLLGNPSFPLCIAVAILCQLRANLLSFGFNECILLFSDMPEIDIEKCVRDSVKFFCSMPKSVTYRQHENKNLKGQILNDVLSFSNPQETNGKNEDNIPLDLGMDPLPLEILKSEVSPRISAQDLLDLLGLSPGYATRQPKIKLLVIDVRCTEEFHRGAIPDSINIPFQTAFTPDGELNSCPEASTIYSKKGKLVVVVGNRGTNASNFSSKLVRLKFPRVCVLHKGIDVLRPAGILVVPST